MEEYTEEAVMLKQCGKSRILAILAAALVLSAGVAVLAGTVTKTGTFYVVKVATSGSAGSMVVKITTTGTNGYHCNMLYPWKLTVDPGDGIAVAKPKLKKEDAAQFTEAAVVFEVPYTATEAAKSVSATLKLSLCDDKQCQMESVALSWPAR
jgi:hypothetical protein